MTQNLKAWLTEPIARKSALRLTAFFLSLFFVVSVASLSVRNIYDDEYANLRYTSMSLPEVIHTANTSDVHPPGMYLLTWCAYHLIPSPRWMNLLPLCFLFAGLSVFCIALAPFFRNRASCIAFLLVATLHPQLIMWGNTVRWYSWWTGIALATIVIVLKPNSSSRSSFVYRKAVILGLLLAALFYLNYITLLFFAALVAGMAFHFGWKALKPLLLTAALFAVLIYPQLHTFLSIHIPNAKHQSSGALISAARLVQATLCSEAFLPWHPLAIAAVILFGALLVTGLLWISKFRRTTTSPAVDARILASITLFALIFFCLVAISGLGIKPRNGLLLLPLLAVPVALALGSLRWQLQAIALLLFTLWIAVGSEHLLLRAHLAKSNMINRPEEVTSYIARTRQANCNVVVTYDSLLAFTVAQKDSIRISLLTPKQFPLPTHLEPQSISQCGVINLYLVRSSLNDIAAANQIASELDASASLLSNRKTLNFSFDPDATGKRRFASLLGGSDIPTYRYVVTSAQVTAETMHEVTDKLQHFR